MVECGRLAGGDAQRRHLIAQLLLPFRMGGQFTDERRQR